MGSRARKLKYQQAILKEEQLVYNRQRSLLPVLIVLISFFFIFLITNIFSGADKNIFNTSFQGEKFEINIGEKGLYKFDFKNKANSTYKGRVSDVKSEIFILQNNKKLYHFFIDGANKNTFSNQSISYYFREAGNYTVKLVHSPRTEFDSNQAFVTQQEVVVKKRSGNYALLKWGYKLFFLAAIVILLIKDYFGRASNYKRIIENKEINWKNKAFYVSLTLAIVWYLAGLFLAYSGYGFAGYSNDMHAPAESVQIDNNYYIN